MLPHFERRHLLSVQSLTDYRASASKPRIRASRLGSAPLISALQKSKTSAVLRAVSLLVLRVGDSRDRTPVAEAELSTGPLVLILVL